MQFKIYLLNQFFIKLILSLLKLLLLEPIYQMQPQYFLLFFLVDLLLIFQHLILLSSFLFSSYFLNFGRLMNHLIFIIIFHSNIGFLYWLLSLKEVTQARHLLLLFILFLKVFSPELAYSRLLESSQQVGFILCSHLHCRNQNHCQNFLLILLLPHSLIFLHRVYQLL